MDELYLMDCILDVLKRRPIIVGQVGTVFQCSYPSGVGLVEMQFVRVPARHIWGPGNGMTYPPASRKHQASVLIGENADPGPCNNQESGDDNYRDAHTLPQITLTDENA